MDIQEKLRVLADAAKYDASCASSGSKRARAPGGLGNAEGSGICHSYAPDGRCISLLKILLTNYCIYDCVYCVNRISSDVRRARFSPREVAQLTIDFYKRNYIEGLFLSSGVMGSADATMEELIEAARILREEHRFCGYIHLKAVAGASEDLVKRAGFYADRVSANIEVPESAELSRLAPGKSHAQIEATMNQMKRSQMELVPASRALVQKKPAARLYLPAGQSTQIIVGATPSSDLSILTKSSQLYQKYRLRRVYYSAFSPIPDADPSLPLESPALVREHRLYQADWLLRFYGFRVEELVTDNITKNLSLDQDPKLSWALAHREKFPVNVNKAPKAALLRVPGLGVRNVDRIISARRYRKLRLEDLARLRVPLNKSRYFLETLDWNPALKYLDSNSLVQSFSSAKARQLSLFESAPLAQSGEL